MKHSERLHSLVGANGHLSTIKTNLPYLKFTVNSVGGTDVLTEVGEDYAVVRHTSSQAICVIPLSLFVVEVGGV